MRAAGKWTLSALSDDRLSAISSWVKAHYKSVTIGGQPLYDLTQPTS